jgi:hypothetical protein
MRDFGSGGASRERAGAAPGRPAGSSARPAVVASLFLVLVGSGAFACRRAGGSAGPPRNLVLVTVDTLRADHLGAYGDSTSSTPQLDALAARSTVFERAYAVAPFTLPSVTAILTGRRPERTGAVANGAVVHPDVPTLATLLHGAGFATAAVVGSVVLHRACGLARGFDLYDDHYEEQTSTRHLPVRSAREVTQAALSAVDQLRRNEGGRRILLWVHYQDPHGPYTPPERFRRRHLERALAAPDGRRELPVSRSNRGLGAIPAYQYVDGHHDVAFYRAGYAGEVEYLDGWIGQLLDGLRERGLLDDTVVMVVADHGEGLGDHDYWFAHGEYLTDVLVHVPFLLYVPGRPPERRPDLVSQIDIAPTLVAALGLAPGRPGPGRNLLAPNAVSRTETPIFASYHESTLPRVGMVVGRLKYVRTYRNGHWVEEVRRISAHGEQTVADADPFLPALREHLLDVRSGLGPASPVARQVLSEGDLARLRALGYAETR